MDWVTIGIVSGAAAAGAVGVAAVSLGIRAIRKSSRAEGEADTERDIYREDGEARARGDQVRSRSLPTGANLVRLWRRYRRLREGTETDTE